MNKPAVNDGPVIHIELTGCEATGCRAIVDLLNRKGTQKMEMD
jgi:hypothetical protein